MGIKQKLFASILHQKSSISSEASEFKDDEQSQQPVSIVKSQMIEKAAELKERGSWNIFKRITMSDRFNFLIILSIIVNTILLCMERYPMSQREQIVQEYFNLLFSIVFLVEMIIKLLGFGIIDYFRDRFNVFD